MTVIIREEKLLLRISDINYMVIEKTGNWRLMHW